MGKYSFIAFTFQINSLIHIPSRIWYLWWMGRIIENKENQLLGCVILSKFWEATLPQRIDYEKIIRRYKVIFIPHKDRVKREEINLTHWQSLCESFFLEFTTISNKASLTLDSPLDYSSFYCAKKKLTRDWLMVPHLDYFTFPRLT